MPSYTAPHPVTYQLPPAALSNPVAAEQWANSLPGPAQALLVARARGILMALPEASRAALARYLVQCGTPIPPELSRTSLGTLGDASAGSGAGGYGAAIGALVGAAASIYSAREASSAQRDILGNTLATDQNIAQIQASAYLDATKALADVQGSAAQIAGQAAVARSQVHGQTLVTVMPWVAGMTGLGVVAFGIWAWSKKRKKA